VSTDLSGLELRLGLNALDFGLSALVDLVDTLLTLTLDDLELPINDR
jgi:hypothetical protein